MNQPQRLRGSELDAINQITERIIGCAIEVHRTLGPGLLEAMYDTALRIESDDRSVRYESQVRVPASYKGRPLGDYRMDFVVENTVIGLLVNFNVPLRKDRINRKVL